MAANFTPPPAQDSPHPHSVSRPVAEVAWPVTHTSTCAKISAAQFLVRKDWDCWRFRKEWYIQAGGGRWLEKGMRKPYTDTET